MNHRNMIAGAFSMTLLLGCSGAAQAQLTGPVPDKKETKPDYVPPAQPPTKLPDDRFMDDPDQKPVAFSLVEMDDAGHVKFLEIPFVEAAVRRVLDGATPQRRQVSMAVIDRRHALMQQQLAANAETAIACRAKMRSLKDIANQKEGQALGDLMKPLILPTTLDNDCFQKNGLTYAQIKLVREELLKYRQELNRSARKNWKGDNEQLSMIVPPMQNAIRANWLEPNRELERMLVALAGKWQAVKGALSVTATQQESISAHESALASAQDNAARADAMELVLAPLTPDQKKIALLSVAVPVPPELPGTDDRAKAQILEGGGHRPQPKK